MGYKAKDLTVYINNINIIDKISFDFPSGSYVSIIGPNGAGKTTLLKTLAGLLNYKGSLSINNQNVRSYSKILIILIVLMSHKLLVYLRVCL